MLSTNVLCIKKRKKRSYCIAGGKSEYGAGDKHKRPTSGGVNMLQITEDTPPDMLAGAMDLTVHLPNGRAVKMSVERSTPMMDLLVHITTHHQLQLSGYTLEALDMAPSNDRSDRFLPFKPNTPIGTLDTQHVKVIPKPRTIPVPKTIAPGKQPFESTFRLKVHLPRNQLFVTRVSQSVHLGDIMKKVCEEKNLDNQKYELRHPGNLDEVLDPKLTLSDYQITEIYVVPRGTGSLNQTFSTSDIMALRKEEERKQMHNKTGGGVFNLIFRRGNKSSTGSGSLSSENRSISPTQSDDSRSVTPPAIQQTIITPPSQEPPVDKPKPPLRKRRPAPKPPQIQEEKPEKASSNISDTSKKSDTGLIISHSRNSSDSSGYHEASILSDNCNTSLPRRPKSTMIMEDGETSNLKKMSAHSKSTSSLGITNRKKKSAPPPPPAPVLQPPVEIVASVESPPSPVVASQPVLDTNGNGHELTIDTPNPVPVPRTRTKIAPIPRSRASNTSKESLSDDVEKSSNLEAINPNIEHFESLSNPSNDAIDQELSSKSASLDIPKTEEHVEIEKLENSHKQIANEDEAAIDSLNERLVSETVNFVIIEEASSKLDPLDETKPVEDTKVINQKDNSEEMIMNKVEADTETQDKELLSEAVNPEITKEVETTREDSLEELKASKTKLLELQKLSVNEIFKTEAFVTTPDVLEETDENDEKPSVQAEEVKKPPEVIALHPKPSKKEYSKSMFDSYTRKRGFQIGTSLLKHFKEDSEAIPETQSQMKKVSSDLSVSNSVQSALDAFNFEDEIDDVDIEMFSGSLSKKSKQSNLILNELHGMHEFEKKKEFSSGSLRSISSVPGFMSSNMKKWGNFEELDIEANNNNNSSGRWVIGDNSDTESTVSNNTSQNVDFSITSAQSLPNPIIESNAEMDNDWQYQLPSPPKAFRDSSPVVFESKESVVDSVVTSPELFEKLNDISKNEEDKQLSSDVSVVSEDDKPILNKLSLEHLEKRKSLVYNRELATSFKISDEEDSTKTDSFSNSLTKFEKTYEEMNRSSRREVAPVVNKSTLPNFKITTYDNPKQKLNIFEDDTIRSNTNCNSSENSKRNSYVETPRRVSEESATLHKTHVGRSMENLSFSRKSSLSDDSSKKSNDYQFYKPKAVKNNHFSVNRSESFSTEQWTPSKPVTRSKSQVALNKGGNTNGQLEDENLSKSNSLFDVSGLQSLGVMRLIQNKLNTPTSSIENLANPPSQDPPPPQQKDPIKTPKPYQYRTPSINMGTWSERPKIPVNVKEDPDYKYSNTKLIVNTINNDVKSNNVSIKVNGSEPISTQNSGNVVIRIGDSNYRKPLGNVNTNQRPHSVAFGNDFDISRVPIVRSVEFKKPYKDFQNNTSVTQIYNNNNINRSSETIITNNNNQKNDSTTTSTITSSTPFRYNNYLQNSSVPTVRGFRPTTQNTSNVASKNNNIINNRNSWHPSSFATLPAKTTSTNFYNHSNNDSNKKEFSTNQSVPFSQSNLRRTESTKLANDNKSISAPPPAPIMPKLTPVIKSFDHSKQFHQVEKDPKEQLLQAIRDFGGKKGLRAVKA